MSPSTIYPAEIETVRHKPPVVSQSPATVAKRQQHRYGSAVAVVYGGGATLN